MKPFSVDVHAHVHVLDVDALVAQVPEWALDVQASTSLLGGPSAARNRQLFETEWRQALTDVEARRSAMKESGIDMQVVSVSPLQYHYWAEEALAREIVAATNEGIGRLAASDSHSFSGLATVALRFPELAAEQLRDAVERLGLRGVEIPTRAGELDFSAPGVEPFWATAEELGAVVFIHPWGCSLGERLSPFYLANTVGNPTETAVGLSHLVFGGVLDRYPKLRVCAAHGGGYLPYYIGRSDHAWRVRPESHTCACPPSEYLRRMWFDSLVYRSDTLRALIDVVGLSQVVLGTDYPFDMGVSDPLVALNDVAGLSDQERDAIAGLNAANLFRIALPAEDSIPHPRG